MKKQEDQSTTTTTVVADERLTAEEERILRMRAGASLPGTAALGNKLDAVADTARGDVAARLRLIEAELLAGLAESEGAPAPDPDRKARIIAALRDKAED
ncbi:MAG: hypothetical protein H6705_21470 [Myxococcales bacterium]|nr:hypothetical protein [Myxococcales bacterium]